MTPFVSFSELAYMYNANDWLSFWIKAHLCWSGRGDSGWRSEHAPGRSRHQNAEKLHRTSGQLQ